MCDAKTNTFGPIPVWTGKSSTVWLFFPATGVLDTGSVKEARARLELSQGTGDIEIRVAMRTSNDGTTWSTPVELSAQTQTGDGTEYGLATSTCGTPRASPTTRSRTSSWCSSGSL